MIGVDVGSDDRPGLVERLEFVAPDGALLELSDPRLDEGLGLGVAVAVAAMGDAVLGQAGAERAAGKGVPLSLPSISWPRPMRRSATAASMTAMASWRGSSRTAGRAPFRAHARVRRAAHEQAPFPWTRACA